MNIIKVEFEELENKFSNSDILIRKYCDELNVLNNIEGLKTTKRDLVFDCNISGEWRRGRYIDNPFCEYYIIKS